MTDQPEHQLSPLTADDGWPNLIYWRDGRSPALRQLDDLIDPDHYAHHYRADSVEDLLEFAIDNAGFDWGEVQQIRALEYLGNLTTEQVTEHGTAWVPHAAQRAQDSYTESINRARRALEDSDPTYTAPPPPRPTADDTPSLTS